MRANRSKENAEQAWRDRLDAYIALGDRGQEPVFAGRSALFRKTARVASAVSQGFVEGKTMTVSGAAGAGKT